MKCWWTICSTYVSIEDPIGAEELMALNSKRGKPKKIPLSILAMETRSFCKHYRNHRRFSFFLKVTTNTAKCFPAEIPLCVSTGPSFNF
ncbi:hypothetical protein CEXT_732591 [Caerostris extrusa]|uniref:Uncharacterized protein n=1 Tax=Caerostris extrusa TaxID=172846 RepID=A0AAV4R1D9_CAEEX|nr:hypothetical protein CEXT_732591 [Caerostris extrusa]